MRRFSIWILVAVASHIIFLPDLVAQRPFWPCVPTSSVASDTACAKDTIGVDAEHAIVWMPLQLGMFNMIPPGYAPESLQWREFRTRWLRERGLAFVSRYPSDPRNAQWLISTVAMPPMYLTDVDSAARLISHDSSAWVARQIDSAAKRRWDKQYAVLRAAFMSSPSVSEKQRQRLRYGEMIAQRIEILAALRRGEEVDVSAYQDSLLDYAAKPPADPHHDARMLANLFFSDAESALLNQGDVARFIEAARRSPNAELRAYIAGKEARRGDLMGRPMRARFTSVDGQVIDLERYYGQVVLVDLWATTCSSCIHAFEGLSTLYRKYHERGFEIISVALDEQSQRGRVLEIIRQHKLLWPQAMIDEDRPLENEFVRRYQTFGVPDLFLLDRKGRLIASGTLDAKNIESYLPRLLATP